VTLLAGWHVHPANLFFVRGKIDDDEKLTPGSHPRIRLRELTRYGGWDSLMGQFTRAVLCGVEAKTRVWRRTA
jgi:hypothetical protein